MPDEVEWMPTRRLDQDREYNERWSSGDMIWLIWVELITDELTEQIRWYDGRNIFEQWWIKARNQIGNDCCIRCGELIDEYDITMEVKIDLMHELT